MHVDEPHVHRSFSAQQILAEHDGPSEGASISEQRQPSPVAPHDTALHAQRRPSAGQPWGAQQIASGSTASSHVTSLGVVASVHEHDSPLPKDGNEHLVLLRADGALHSSRQRSSRQSDSC